MSIINFSTHRPVTVFMGVVAISLFGWISLQRLPTNLLPDITYPSLTIRTIYAGSAPEEIETILTRPIEEAVGTVNGVLHVRSTSKRDQSDVVLEFTWGTNMDYAIMNVREKLDFVNLPINAEKPIILRFDPSQDPIMRIMVSGDEDLVSIRKFADTTFRRQLERVEGVAAVTIYGGLEEEIQVLLRPDRMRALGISSSFVINRLQQENINLAGGRLQDGGTEYLVRTIKEFKAVDDIADVVLEVRNNAFIRLEDVATVKKGHEERKVIASLNGLEGVEVAIFKAADSNTVQVAEGIAEVIKNQTERLDQSRRQINLQEVADQSKFIRQSIQEVGSNLLYGGLFAIVVLFLFLRNWKSMGIISVTIPTSILCSFFFMYLSGVTLNVMSLGGLALGVGMLVDNAIVVLEAIQRYREEGLAAGPAVRKGASEVATAVTASTLTTVCVFLPIVFVEGVAAQLFRDQALTVTFSLLASLGVALTLIPMLSSRELHPPVVADGKAQRAQRKGLMAKISSIPETIGKYLMKGILTIARLLLTIVNAILWLPGKLFEYGYESLLWGYQKVLNFCVRMPIVPILIILALGYWSLQLLRGFGGELVPELVQGEFVVNVDAPPGTQVEVLDNRFRRWSQQILELPDVQFAYGLAGTTLGQGSGSTSLEEEHIGQIQVRLVDADGDREQRSMDDIRSILAPYQNWNYLIQRPSYFSFRTPVEVVVRGYSMQLLSEITNQLVAQIGEIDGVDDLETNINVGNPEIVLRFDRDKLNLLGVNLNDISQFLRTQIQGEVATDIPRPDRNIDIRVWLDEKHRQSLQDLSNLTFTSSDGTAIPISAVASLEESTSPAEIYRFDQERVALISGNIKGRSLMDVSADLENLLIEQNYPVGYSAYLGGQNEEMKQSFTSLQFALALAIFLVYLVMASQFESLLHPFVILFTIPFGLVGVAFTLALFDQPPNIMVFIGVVMLAGIVVNNAIVLIDRTNQLRRQGMERIEAVKTACGHRFRPILMTTATTVLGLLPMALGQGEGSELRMPLAITVIGGLVVSTGLTLLVLPSLYLLIDRRQSLSPISARKLAEQPESA